MSKRKKIMFITLGALVVVTVALVMIVSYRPIVIAGPRVETARLELQAPLPGLRLHVFNTGMNKMSSLLVGPAPPWRAAPAFIIEHPNHGLIAFDLGLSHEVAEHGEKAIPPPVGWLMKSRGRIGLTLEAQMKEVGLLPERVEHVLLSHLHGDHTGVAAEFVHAKFYAGRDTKQRVLEDSQALIHSSVVPDWHEVDFSEGSEFDVTPLGPFPGAVDLFGDGSIHIVDAGGHTDEDIMALVNLPSGAVLLAGDAVVHFDWLASDDVERIAGDPEQAAIVRNQIRSLHGSGEVLVIPGHDLRKLRPPRPDLLLHHPERFEVSAWPVEGD